MCTEPPKYSELRINSTSIGADHCVATPPWSESRLATAFLFFDEDSIPANEETEMARPGRRLMQAGIVLKGVLGFQGVLVQGHQGDILGPYPAYSILNHNKFVFLKNISD